MMIASLLVLNGMCAAGVLPPLEGAMPIRVTGAWTIEAGPGTVTIEGIEHTLASPVALEVAPPEIVKVRDECHENAPIFDRNGAPWNRGAKLEGLRAEECNSTGLLFPETVRVKPGPGACTPFALDKDYLIDGSWANFGRTPDGAIAARQTIYVDYDYSPCRIDRLFLGKDGKVRLAKGAPHVALPMPPAPAAGERAIANIWVPGKTEKLSDDNLYPIEFGKAPQPPAPALSQAEQFLPKTLAKLRAGETVTYVAFGDSVTCGGGVGNQIDAWYQNQFATLLRTRFPKANLRVLTAGWGGASSKAYIEAPRGGTYDFVRDVLEPKADFVSIEFVNDAYLDEAGVAAHYAGIVKQIRDTGAEVVLITPHFVRPDWMNSDTLKPEQDPRPYVRGLKEFAAKNTVALADASTEWCRLWRQGLPYITLLANNINHPDARGHAIFAKVLIGLFPAS